MTLTKQTEFIRLVNNEPLTLYCSALADFLWDDFIRDARPNVTYLIDHYKILQLSRFGKELFERLYNADLVSWVVTEDAYEDYFRKVCNGDATAIPEGYKPENGIWHAIMSDLSQAAAWPELLYRSTGDQFNSGNNAVNILNELSEVIEQAIEEGSFDAQMLTSAGSALEDLREKYKEAVAKNDEGSAKDLRRQGKELRQKINEAVEQAREKIQTQTHKIIDSVIKKNDEVNEALSSLHGDSEGVGSHTNNLADKKELAKKLQRNSKLRQLVKKLGALRKVWHERKRAKKVTDKYESITGCKFSDDLTRAFPAEIALATTEKGRALFALKYAQKTLLTKDFTSHRKDVGRGPIVMYVDVSGSMQGEPELWCKALTFVIAEEAVKQKRAVEVHLFDTRITNSVELNPSVKQTEDLLNFVGTWVLGGGTSFNAVLAHAIDRLTNKDRADVLLITDGQSEVHENFIYRLKKLRTEKGVQWSTICVNNGTPPVCARFSDQLFAVNMYSEADAVDAVQQCF